MFESNYAIRRHTLKPILFYRQDPLTISTPNVKLLVYKDSKKNIHRVMKLRADRKSALNTRNAEVELPEDHQDDQWLKDNIHTMEVDISTIQFVTQLTN